MNQLEQLPVLRTERLRLRQPRMSDAARIREYASDARVAEMTAQIPHPYPENSATEWIEVLQAERKADDEIVFAVTRKEEDELLGVVGVQPNENGYVAELGFWVGVPHWGQGYCTEAASEVLRFCFEDLALERIFAGHLVGNDASGRVQEKIGMRKEGCARWGVFRFGEPKDLVLYGIIRPDWEALQRR